MCASKSYPNSWWRALMVLQAERIDKLQEAIGRLARGIRPEFQSLHSNDRLCFMGMTYKLPPATFLNLVTPWSHCNASGTVLINYECALAECLKSRCTCEGQGPE